MIFGHFIYFGHFPIEIPIEAEKIYHHGKELSYRENKMCSETSEAVGTIWEHAQKEFQKFLKIRITLPKRKRFMKIVWIPLISIPGRRPWTQRTGQPRSSARMIAIAGAFTTQSRTVLHSFIPLCFPLSLVRRSELMQSSSFSSPALTYTFRRD